eukprot:TRINITY_DN7360_c0_g1_i10.p1 TRINITY_DN7360_c0_g1~~TRINITY_DN7360_c0_g1_i10.p1  ORF type:complete len:176 (-),score=21.66 TRINITY_DN7360_c0_g1_i10:26-553(-)
MSLELDQYELTKSLSIYLLRKVLTGDALLSRLTPNEQEVLKKKDPWRRFSPFVGKDISLNYIWIYVTKMTSVAVSEECSILSVVLLERFIEYKNIVVCTQNIFPLITSAYILACKVHEDACRGLLVEINRCLPFMSITLLKRIEGLFFRSVGYNLNVGIDQFMTYVDRIIIDTVR